MDRFQEQVSAETPPSGRSGIEAVPAEQSDDHEHTWMVRVADLLRGLLTTGDYDCIDGVRHTQIIGHFG